jgi:hypothetical protein
VTYDDADERKSCRTRFASSIVFASRVEKNDALDEHGALWDTGAHEEEKKTQTAGSP